MKNSSKDQETQPRTQVAKVPPTTAAFGNKPEVEKPEVKPEVQPPKQKQSTTPVAIIEAPKPKKRKIEKKEKPEEEKEEGECTDDDSDE